VSRGLNRGNRQIIGAAVVASGAGPGQRVADVGFGGGIGLRMLLDRVGPSGSVDGVDVSATMVAQARRTFAAECAAGRVRVTKGSMLELPLPDNSLDAVITNNTVYFLDEVGRALSELHRVLKPGGRLVIGIGDPDVMARAPVTAHGFHLRPVADLIQAMTESGFEDARSERVEHEPMNSLLLIGRA